MAENPRTSPDKTELTSFITAEYYIIGAGETVAESQETGEWLATDAPREIRP